MFQSRYDAVSVNWVALRQTCLADSLRELIRLSAACTRIQCGMNESTNESSNYHHALETRRFEHCKAAGVYKKTVDYEKFRVQKHNIKQAEPQQALAVKLLWLEES